MARAQAFPRQFPEGSFKQVLDYIKGANMDRWTAIEGAYDCLGFALYSVSGGPSIMSGPTASVAAGVPNERAVTKELDRLITESRVQSNRVGADPDNPDSPMAIANLNIPDWLTAFLIQLLQRLLIT